MTYTYTPNILSYATYRFVCDHCEWDTGDHERLSQAVLALQVHGKAHDPSPANTPAPIKPSMILALVR